VSWGRYPDQNPDLVRTCHDELSALAVDGRIAPVAADRVCVNELPGGMERLAAGATIGRAALVW
jgi:NADPH2:quinone reductase